MILQHTSDRGTLPCRFTELALLFILISCTTWNTTSKQSSHVDTLSSNIPGVRGLIDTWDNIHLFQTFDYNISNPSTIAKHYDFIWGTQFDHVAALRAGNPNIFLSYYIPFNRDGGIFPDNSSIKDHNLTYWQAAHPDWILYKCDRVTPAYAFGDPTIPLDFANPALISWQIKTYAQPASVSGYDAIAADNVSLQNNFGACGIYKNGQWVQHYTGRLDDPQWRADVIYWLKQMQQALHQLQHPLALIPNFYQDDLPLSNPQIQQIMSNVDGVLDEEGFTDSGRGYPSASLWVQKVQFIENIQKLHKPYYIINQFPSVGQAEIQWSIASYLMGKEHTAALFISTIQGYGTALWHNEYGVQIGSPDGPMHQVQHVYLRKYSNGLSIVNPSATETATVTLNAVSHYTDLYGNSVGQTVTMPPHAGIVLLLRTNNDLQKG